jgi:hypothetical protein
MEAQHAAAVSCPSSTVDYESEGADGERWAAGYYPMLSESEDTRGYDLSDGKLLRTACARP